MMGGLFKILLFTSPVLGLIFFYVVSQQSKIDVKIEKDDAVFERSWNEFQANFSRTPEQRQKYLDRALGAEERIREFEEKEKLEEKKAEEFRREFEKAIQEFEEEQQQKGGQPPATKPTELQ
jgi:hypothetical protein